MKLKTIRKFGLTPPAPAPSTAKKAAAKKAGAAKKATAKKGLVAAAPASNVVATLDLSVTKSGGPVATSIEVGSAGGVDDHRFSDAQLTPGPVTVPLLAGNTYAIVWQGAFVAPGKATLKVKATDAQGNVFVQKSLDAKNPPLGATFTIVVL